MHAPIAHRRLSTGMVDHSVVPVRTRLALVRTGVGLALMQLAGVAHAAQVVIDGPAGSDFFGRTVTTLPNGNIVVTDPGYDAPGPVIDVGAVYLYRPDGTLISTARGSSFEDQVGSDGVVVLANGNYVVISPNWSNDAGAVTFGSGTNGITGVISSTNSLVGGTEFDRVGESGVTPLPNGNYVVSSRRWDNGAVRDAGAVTFGSGTSGITGMVSPLNSLVGGGNFASLGTVTVLTNGNYVVTGIGTATFASGTTGITGAITSANSLVGSSLGGNVRVFPLANGNYVVHSLGWINGTILQAGAVTFGSGTTGVTGVISPANSLVGSSQGDSVGSFSTSDPLIYPLANGNYVVSSPLWDNGSVADVGALTLGSGTTGITGEISSANSLVGSTAQDRVGRSGVIALTNSNYVVSSPGWDNGSAVDAGAVTFGSGTSGITGVVSSTNSLVGSSTSDLVGAVTALSNGNYVVTAAVWDNGAAVDAGAVTFGSGTTGITGEISATNSLVGGTAQDEVGFFGVTPLANGNYVVNSWRWDNGSIVNAGAVTFGSGTSGISGAVSASNSLVGNAENDSVGFPGVTALSNGNYVVRSAVWSDVATPQAGAVTFGSGTNGITGLISLANSLIGVTPGDSVGSNVTALPNGSYVVRSPNWDNGATVDVGAVTFGSGTSAITGVVSAANSLIGSRAGDLVGESDVTALPNGNYVVNSRSWDNGVIANAGAITLGLSDGSVVGAITDTHSVLGLVPNFGNTQTFSYDASRNQLAVGQPLSNRVVLHRTGIATAISIVGSSADPSFQGQPVNFTATTTASPTAPTDGRVTFTTSSGESCVDTTPTATSAATATWSCTITFTATGVSTVVAEYTGSIIHAYSGSASETHTVIVEPALFANSFESP